MMKQKFILYLLIFCIASSSASTKASDRSLFDWCSCVAASCITHYIVDSPSMNTAERLRYHALYFMYRNLVGLSTTACHELGHALSHTLAGNQVTDIKIDPSIPNICTGLYTGETATNADNLESLRHATKTYVTEQSISDKERALKLCSAIKKFHMQNIIAIGMGPISGLVFTAATYTALIKLYGSEKGDYYHFFFMPIVNNALFHATNLVPFLSTDGTQLAFYIPGLYAIHQLKNSQDTDELEQYIKTYLPSQVSCDYEQYKKHGRRLTMQEQTNLALQKQHNRIGVVEQTEETLKILQTMKQQMTAAPVMHSYRNALPGPEKQ